MENTSFQRYQCCISNSTHTHNENRVERESEELQAKIKELQEQQKKLKEEKERIKAQISNKKDIKEEDKKEEDKKEEGKKEDKKEEDKKEENTPTIGLKKISFSLLDSEGKYNPKYTAEYTNGIQQEAKRNNEI